MTASGVVRRSGTALPIAPRPPMPATRPLGERHVTWTAACPDCGRDTTWKATSTPGAPPTIDCPCPQVDA